jgi:NAD-dependent DNA ligase
MELDGEVICTYLSQRMRLSVQNLLNSKVIVNSNDEPIHVQGWCARNGSPRTLRVDQILEIHDSLTEAEAYFDYAKIKLTQEGFDFETKRSKGASRYSSPDTMDICFTGFKKSDKDQLIALANEKEMSVRGEVTKHLDILCYGYNAGPKKLEKALNQGAMILNRQQFENLLSTGEVPEDIYQ